MIIGLAGHGQTARHFTELIGAVATGCALHHVSESAEFCQFNVIISLATLFKGPGDMRDARAFWMGLYKPSSESLLEHRAKPAEWFEVELLHRAVPVVNTPKGIRATKREADPFNRPSPDPPPSHRS